MRRDDQIVQRQQRVIESDGFRRSYIQRRAGNLPVAQGAIERRRVNHRAARHIDENGRGLHHGQFGGADQMVGCRRQRHAQYHKVGLRQQFRERGVADAIPGFGFRFPGAGMVEDVQIKPAPAPGDFQADLPQADDAQGGFVDILPQPVGGVKLYLPSAGAYPALTFRSAPGRAQQQRKGQVGGGFRQHARRVAHRDAPSGGRAYSHVVQPHRQLADDAQVRGGVHKGRIHLVHYGGKDPVRAGGQSMQFRNRWRPFVRPQGDFRHRADDGQGIGQQGAGNDGVRTQRHKEAPEKRYAPIVMPRRLNWQRKATKGKARQGPGGAGLSRRCPRQGAKPGPVPA